MKKSFVLALALTMASVMPVVARTPKRPVVNTALSTVSTTENDPKKEALVKAMTAYMQESTKIHDEVMQLRNNSKASPEEKRRLLAEYKTRKLNLIDQYINKLRTLADPSKFAELEKHREKLKNSYGYLFD